MLPRARIASDGLGRVTRCGEDMPPIDGVSGKPGVDGPVIAAKPSGSSPELPRSEEHTSELQSLMRISYAVFRLKKKKNMISALAHHHTSYPGMNNPNNTRPDRQ